VFDPGINALSIVTKIMPEPLFVRRAELEFPANRDAPIAATLDFGSSREGADLKAVFDWRQTGPQSWDIEIETEAGQRLVLAEGGSRLTVDGRLVAEEKPQEYGASTPASPNCSIPAAPKSTRTRSASWRMPSCSGAGSRWRRSRISGHSPLPAGGERSSRACATG
jgi:hypothetical protein